MKRSLAASVAALLSAGVLAGCSHPFHAGAAAVVGDDRISTADLRTMVDRGLAGVPESSTSKPTTTDLEQLDLTQLIQLSVLKHMAKDLKAEPVTDAKIDAELAAAATSSSVTQAQLEQNAAAQGVDPKTLRTFAEVVAYEKAVLLALPIDQSKVAAQYEADKASKYEEVHVAHILVADKATADSIFAQVQADPSKFAALAKQYSTDTGSKDNGGDLGLQPHGAYVKEFGDAAWAGKDGTIIGPVQSQFGYHIIKVIEHKTISLADATDDIKFGLNADAFAAAYKKAAAEAKISVNPRFGVWAADAGSNGLGQVQASDDNSLSTPVSPSPSAASSADTGSSSTDSGGGAAGGTSGSGAVAPTTGTTATATPSK